MNHELIQSILFAILAGLIVYTLCSEMRENLELGPKKYATCFTKTNKCFNMTKAEQFKWCTRDNPCNIPRTVATPDYIRQTGYVLPKPLPDAQRTVRKSYTEASRR